MAQGDARESRAGQQKRRDLLAPIIRSKRRRYQTSSVVEGVQHIIEGMPERDVRTASFQPGAHRGLSPKERYAQGGLASTLFNARERKAWGTEVADFRRKQEMRRSIVSLPDPEDLRELTELRREAARRRRRGRAGTMLARDTGGELG